MWKKLKALFLKKDSEAEFDLFSPKQRMIYAYFDGEKVVRRDPIVLYRRVCDVGPELAADIKIACAPIKAAQKAGQKMLEKVQVIFDVKPFDGEKGLTEAEMATLLNHFMTYCDGVKKNWFLSTTPLAETPESSPPTEAGDSATTSSSASGSSAEGESTNVPTSSPPASA